jgi:hypothetical protein
MSTSAGAAMTMVSQGTRARISAMSRLKHVAALILGLTLTSCGSASSSNGAQDGQSAQETGAAGASGKLDDAAIAEIRTGIENGSIADRGSQGNSKSSKPTAMKYHCQGNGVVAFEADVPPAFAGGGVVYFRDKRQWAATGNHVLTGVELCNGDRAVEGISTEQIDKLKQQLSAGVDLNGSPATVLEDVVFSGTWTNSSGTLRLVFIGYSPSLGMMQTARYVPSQERWAPI